MSKKWAAAISFNPYFLSNELLTLFEDFCIENSSSYAIITEKENDKRHIHAILLLEKWKEEKKGVRLDKFKDAVVKWQMKFDDNWDSKCNYVTRQGCKIVYNYEWREKYLEKNVDETTKIIADNLPENYDDYLPSELEQLKAIKLAEAKKNELIKDHFFNKLSIIFEEMKYSFDDCNGLEVLFLKKTCDFLADIMYVSKKIAVIQDPKRQRQVATSFYRYYLGLRNGCDRILSDSEAKLLESITAAKELGQG